MPLIYFQLVVVLLLVLGLSVVVVLSGHRGWVLVVFAAIIALVCWILPRMGRLEIDCQKLTVAEGPSDKELREKMPYVSWDSADQEPSGRLAPILTFLAIMAAALTVLAILQYCF